MNTIASVRMRPYKVTKLMYVDVCMSDPTIHEHLMSTIEVMIAMSTFKLELEHLTVDYNLQ